MLIRTKVYFNSQIVFIKHWITFKPTAVIIITIIIKITIIFLLKEKNKWKLATNQQLYNQLKERRKKIH